MMMEGGRRKDGQQKDEWMDSNNNPLQHNHSITPSLAALEPFPLLHVSPSHCLTLVSQT